MILDPLRLARSCFPRRIAPTLECKDRLLGLSAVRILAAFGVGVLRVRHVWFPRGCGRLKFVRLVAWGGVQFSYRIAAACIRCLRTRAPLLSRDLVGG
jgi:hypothetical protein